MTQTATIYPKIAYSLPEVAALCSISERKVQRAIEAKELAGVKEGRRTIIRHEAVLEWLDSLPNWGS